MLRKCALRVITLLITRNVSRMEHFSTVHARAMRTRFVRRKVPVGALFIYWTLAEESGGERDGVVRRRRRMARNSKAFEKIANASAAGEKARLYAARLRHEVDVRTNEGRRRWRRQREICQTQRQRGERKFHVLRQFPRRSDEYTHGTGTGIIHAWRNSKKFRDRGCDS